MPARTLLSVLALTLVATQPVGCTDGEPPAPADAGDDGTVATGPPPAPPVFAPCPVEWRSVTEGDIVTCDPWPESGPATCGDGEAHFVGDSGCAPVGAPCPSGPFPESLPPGARVLFVLAGAPAGGDGTETSPFANITDALAVTSVGTIVAVGKGRYDEAIDLPAGVTLWGACARDTLVTTSVYVMATGTIRVATEGVTVRNIGVSTPVRLGILVQGAAASLDLDGVIVTDAVASGIIVDAGAHLTAREIVVRGTRPRASDGGGGSGLGVHANSEVTIERAVFERVLASAIGIRNASVTATDVVVRDTLANPPDQALGAGIVAIGGSVRLARAVLERNRQFALGVAGATVDAEDIVIRDTLDQISDGYGGHGLAVTTGATLSGRRVLIERSRYAAVLSDGSSLMLEDLVVRDTAGRPADGTAGSALNAQESADVTVTRAWIEGSHEIAVGANSLGTLRLEDVVVERSEAQECAAMTCPDMPFGIAIGAYRGASVDARRFAVRNASLCGVQAASGGALDLHLGEVAFNPIGACVGVEGYDFARLSDQVRYHDNGTNLQAVDLPVPEPVTGPVL